MINAELIDPLEIYKRVRKGKPYNKNLKIYSKEEIESSIRFFIEEEQYEKCQFLKDFVEIRFNY